MSEDSIEYYGISAPGFGSERAFRNMHNAEVFCYNNPTEKQEGKPFRYITRKPCVLLTRERYDELIETIGDLRIQLSKARRHK